MTRWRYWPQGTRWLVGVLAVIAMALAVGWVLFVPTADWLANHDVGHVTGALRTSRLQTARDAGRGRVLTFAAGLFAVGALTFTALNFNLLRRNSEQADLWQRRTHELTEQGQVTDRYTKAIEQLGSNTIDVSIGGIYALERIARDSPRDHPAVMEVLAACIREHSREQWPLPSSDDPDAELPHRTTRADVQAALTVIGRRDMTHDSGRIDLANVNLSGANLSDAELAGANLIGANLTGVFAARANLADATLINANLTKADLTGANLGGANLPSAQLPEAFMPSVDLHGAHLQRADLTGAWLTSAVLVGAHLRGAKLVAAKLIEADLSGADLGGAQLRRANLANANLTGANLTDADLPDADLGGANLTDANLTGAWLPADAVPEGWACPPGSGRLARAPGHHVD